MFLKSMDLFGFKSFADKTHIKFEYGITAIVGPNGCGKSNVVDAVKWVLGEKKAKNIRGLKMEDIIFSGTELRKPVSLAEVSVTIDNKEKILDIGTESVTIGRRVFRDGESEYLINKSPVRLKDIEKLFMDTGIGKSAYSVMEQGKMDLILSTRAEDRRYIFEEAAGISRYKHQKKESLKKLQDTSDNLERINDIIKEIEREKEFKRKQSEKTKLYLKMMKNFSEFDIKLNIIKYRGLLQKQEKIQEDIEKYKKNREKISSRVSATSADNEKDEKRKNDIQHQLWELDKKLSNYKFRLEDIDSKTEKNRKSIEYQNQQNENINRKIHERTGSLSGLKEEKRKNEQSGIEIKEKIKKSKQELQGFFETRKRKIKSIHDSRDLIEKNRKIIRESEGIQKSLRNDLELVIKELIDAIDKRKAELRGSENERLEIKEKINEGIKNIDIYLIKAKQELEAGMLTEAMVKLEKIDIKSLQSDIGKFESYEDGFRSILFDKTGIHAKKEELDKKISNEIDIIENLRNKNTDLENRIQEDQLELEDINKMITRLEINLSTYETDRDWIERSFGSLNYQIKDVTKQIENHKDEVVRSDSIIKNLKNEINEWENKLIEFNEKSKSLVSRISELTDKREEIEKKIHDRKSISRKDEDELKRIVERISSLDRQLVEFLFRKNNVEDYLWTEYEKKLSDLKNVRVDDFEQNDVSTKIQDLKKEIKDLGPINNLAIKEYEDLKKRFEYYINQKNDIENARKDILSVIDDINRTSVEMFLDTFKEIKKNFSQIFKQLFEGGDASIELMDIENILECGIDILVRPPGKKLKNINLLSGGERALTAIALLFATYMVKPSPFCFLDEIDAPLDEENIRRFVKMLREFAKSTQFIIVTHNKKTLSIVESIYGVTMEELGVSSLVSLHMKKADSLQKFVNG